MQIQVAGATKKKWVMWEEGMRTREHNYHLKFSTHPSRARGIGESERVEFFSLPPVDA